MEILKVLSIIMKKPQYIYLSAVGDPVINNNIISDFSSLDYIQIDNLGTKIANAGAWIVNIKFRTSLTNSGQCIFGNNVDWGTNVRINSENQLIFNVSNDTTSADIGSITGQTVLSDNTDYYVRIEFTGTQYILSLSIDGTTWVEEGTINSPTKITNRGEWLFGAYSVSIWYFRGSIDINNSYIKLNNTKYAFKILNTEPDFTKIPLTFTAEENNCQISLSVSGSPTYSLQYSTDGSSWQTFADSATSTLVPVTLANQDDKVYIKGTYSGQSSTSANIKFTATAKCSVSGNCNSILDGANFATMTTLTASYSFTTLFGSMGDKLINAENLKLPATTLSNYCYYNMFNGCSALVKAPELPATTLASHCYQQMFRSCSALKYIKILYTGNFDTNFSNWVRYISNSGDFYYNGTDTTTGQSAIPSGWTVHTF